MMALVALYVVKTLFLMFLVLKQNEFAFNVQANLSHRLFMGYLRQPWTFHLQRNSAELLRNVISETSTFAHNGLIPGTTLLVESLVLFGVGMLLLIVEPLGALVVVATLGLSAGIFQRLTRGHVLRWGEARQYHEGQRIQHLQQGLGGAKDVKLLGREEGFFVQFSAHNFISARVGRYQNTVLQLPRLMLELLTVIGFAALVLVMILRGRGLDTLLPILGLFAAAAFRLMPSVNRVLNSLQSLRYGLPVIELLHSEIRFLSSTATPERQAPLPFKHTIALEHVCYRYPDTEIFALNDVTLTIPRGAAIGFVGSSGAGKSTLVDVVLGLLAPTSGQVKVDGVDIQANLRGWQDQIGYVPQAIFLTDDTVRRNVAFGLPDDQIDGAAVQRAIHAAQLHDFVNSLPQGNNTLVGERGVRLSGGQRQRIGIARALYHDPQVLVLDEATSALDNATEQGVMDAVNALHGDKTLLIVAHRLSTVAQCDHLYRLEQGRVVDAGSFEGIAKTLAVAP